MIGTGAGKVEGLTGAGKFGGSSVIFNTAFVPSQEVATLRNVGDEVPAAILSNMLRDHLADPLLTRLLTYNDEAQTLPRGCYSQFCSCSPCVDIIATRVISDESFLIRTNSQS